MEDFHFIKRLSKVEKPKPKAPKAAEGMDLQKLGRWSRRANDQGKVMKGRENPTQGHQGAPTQDSVAQGKNIKAN